MNIKKCEGLGGARTATGWEHVHDPQQSSETPRGLLYEVKYASLSGRLLFFLLHQKHQWRSRKVRGNTGSV